MRRRRWMAAAVAGLGPLVLAACVGGVPPSVAPSGTLGVPPPSPVSAVSPVATPATPLPTTLPATPLPSPTADPLPSALDPDVERAIAWRRSMGLRADLDWVLAVAEDPRATYAWAAPILPEEESSIWARNQALLRWGGFVKGYAHPRRDVYGGMRLDMASGRVVSFWTADPEVHLAAILAEAGPDAPIDARLVRWTERELRDVQRRVDWDSPLWARLRAELQGVGVDVSHNAVTIEVSSADPEAPARIAAALANRLRVPAAMFRVESDGTGVALMATGRVKGVVTLADGSAPGPDNGLSIGGRSESPGTCFTEPFGVGPAADGRFTISCTVGTWVITVWTFDPERKRSSVWGESEPVVVSEDGVPRVRIRVRPDTPIGE